LETINSEEIMEAEERQKKLEERSKQERERELNDIKKVLVLPEGRRLLWRVMSAAETFLASTTDKRIIGLMLFNDIMKVAPEIFLQMQREYKSEQESIKKQYPIEAEEF
jgi:hypothetical protein